MQVLDQKFLLYGCSKSSKIAQQIHIQPPARFQHPAPGVFFFYSQCHIHRTIDTDPLHTYLSAYLVEISVQKTFINFYFRMEQRFANLRTSFLKRLYGFFKKRSPNQFNPQP